MIIEAIAKNKSDKEFWVEANTRIIMVNEEIKYIVACTKYY